MVFERFSEPARRAMLDAREIARDRKRREFGTEDLLVALAMSSGSPSSRALQILRLSADDIRGRLKRGGWRTPLGHIKMSSTLKTAVQRAIRESWDRGDNYVGTDHLLLGVISRQYENGIVADLGLTYETVRAAVNAVALTASDNPQADGVTTHQDSHGIMVDDDGNLVLYKHTYRDQEPHWCIPGGIEPTDATIEEALHRELTEQLGAEVSGATRVYFSIEPSSKGGFHVHHFFLTRLKTTDLTSPKISNPANGTYEVDRVSLNGDDLASLDLRPRGLKEYIFTSRQALLAKVASMP